MIVNLAAFLLGASVVLNVIIWRRVRHTWKGIEQALTELEQMRQQ